MSSLGKIAVIGAANIDLIGFSKEKLIFRDSNIGSLETIVGGVGRNIAENLKHLGFNVEFFTVFADDDFSKTIKTSCEKLGISVAHSLEIANSSTSTYMAILDYHNDLALGLSAMDIYDNIPNEFILNHLDVLKTYEYCVLETNMPANILEQAVNSLPNTKFILEAVSAKKALKAKTILDKVYILKCNLIEAELLSGIKPVYESDYDRMVQHFIDIGVKKVFITLGKDGAVYGDSNEVGIFRNRIIEPVNTNGAGDAFTAGIIYGEKNNLSIYETVKFASACAQITILHKKAVHPEINVQKVKDVLFS